MTDDEILGRLLRRIIAESDHEVYGGYRHWGAPLGGTPFITLDLSVNISLDEMAALDRTDAEASP